MPESLMVVDPEDGELIKYGRFGIGAHLGRRAAQ